MDGNDDVEARRRGIDGGRGGWRGGYEARRRGIVDAARRIAAAIGVMLAKFAALVLAPLMLAPFVSAPAPAIVVGPGRKGARADQQRRRASRHEQAPHHV